MFSGVLVFWFFLELLPAGFTAAREALMAL